MERLSGYLDMKLKAPKFSCLLRGFVFLVVIAIFGLYILLPIGVGVSAVFPGKQNVGSPPGGFQEITLTTKDNVTLSGWYMPPSNGAAIILLHGAGGSRESVRNHADMLVRHGYGVLALDLRGHVASTGPVNRLGWQNTPDVGVAIEYLQARPEVKRIGGMGLSMGAEVLLGAASAYPALMAVVADGATRRCLEEMLALPEERPLYRNFTARIMYATVQVLSNSQPPSPLLDSMVAAKPTSFFLIAGGANALEVDFNKLFADTLGERATLWIAPDAPHTGAFGLYPEEYEQRVTTFLDKALLGRSSAIIR